MSLPRYFSSKVRSFAVSKVPLSSKIYDENTLEKLEEENKRLKTELSAVLEWLLFDGRLEKQIELYQSLSEKKDNDLSLREFFQRRAEELSTLLKQKLMSLPAQVVLREPTTWSSFLWIDVGSKNNESLGKLIVAKNSPVIKGNTLIGLVEEVLQDRSRIRLITDTSLIPSVRAVRGNRQDIEMALQLDSITDRIQAQEELFYDEKEKDYFISSLQNLKSRLFQEDTDLYLAKGELHGSYSLSNRKRSSLLKGEGFNYAFADEEGEQRDIYNQKTPLIQSGDLLVTTGYDGIFPKDLDVAIVTKVFPLEIEDYSYRIEAKSTVGNLDDLSTLYVLPPTFTGQ